MNSLVIFIWVVLFPVITLASETEVACIGSKGRIYQKYTSSHGVKRIQCPASLQLNAIITLEEGSELNLQLSKLWVNFTGVSSGSNTLKIVGPSLFRLDRQTVRNIAYSERYRSASKDIAIFEDDNLLSEFADSFKRTLSLVIEPLAALSYDLESKENLLGTTTSSDCHFNSPYQYQKFVVAQFPQKLPVGWTCPYPQSVDLYLWQNAELKKRVISQTDSSTTSLTVTESGTYFLQIKDSKNRFSKIAEFSLLPTHKLYKQQLTTSFIAPRDNQTYVNSSVITAQWSLANGSPIKPKNLVILLKDRSGRTVLKKRASGDQRIRLQGLATGTYTISLENNKNPLPEVLAISRFVVTSGNLTESLHRFLEKKGSGDVSFQDL